MEKKRNAKGEGSFKVNPDGTVTHRKSVGYKASGQRKILTVTASNKSACIKEMKKKEAEWNKVKDRSSVSRGSTVSDLCQMHLLYQVEQGELKPKSIDRRECTIDNHIEAYPLGRMQLSEVRVSDIDTHIRTLIKEDRLSESSIQKVVDVLNAAYNWALVRGEVETNPVAPIKPTLVKRMQKMKQKTVDEADVVVLSAEEEKRFVQEAMLRSSKTGKFVYAAGLYALLLLYTGMRCGEMLALKWKDVDFENRMITIDKSRSVAKNRNRVTEQETKYVMVEGTTKNEKARRIELMPEAMQVLRLIRLECDDEREDALIVTTKSGKGNTATNLEHRVATIFRHAGLTELTSGLHIFRRTFATNMYEKGARVKEIAAYIGDLESTTERYYIAIRKKVAIDGGVQQVVQLPMGSQLPGA